MKLARWVVILLMCTAVVLPANTYTVTKQTYIGPGTIGDAIVNANDHPGPDTIVFDIESMSDPPYYLFSDRPYIPLIDNGTFINGFSQPGSSPNTAAFGEPDNSNIGLIFDGSFTDSLLTPFRIYGDSNSMCGIGFSRIKGTDIDSSGMAIVIDTGSYNHIWGCRFGLDTSKTSDWGNYRGGIIIRNEASNNLIGGNTPEERCLFAGNDSVNVYIKGDGCDDNQIAGCYFGTRGDGLQIPDNLGILGIGILIESNGSAGPDGTIIGGPDSSWANMLAGLPQEPIKVVGPGISGMTISYNRIGANGAGNDLGNATSGIILERSVVDDSILYNWIAYNEGHGIFVNDTNANNQVIMGNLITDNEQDGVRLFGLIQDCEVIENEIANNGGNGIYVAGPASDWNTFSRNSIYGNDGIGIDLAPPIGVSPNDPSDSDDGPNDGMNFPVIDDDETNATYCYGKITGATGGPRDGATVEIFLSDEDPSGYGEGITFVGSGIADASGDFEIIMQGVERYDFLTATATDVDGNTSEFGPSVKVLYAGVDEELPVAELALDARVEPGLVSFTYTLPAAGDARLAVYDASGALVSELVSGHQTPGEHSLTWDSSAPAGVYFARLTAGDMVASTKLLLTH